VFPETITVPAMFKNHYYFTVLWMTTTTSVAVLNVWYILIESKSVWLRYWWKREILVTTKQTTVPIAYSQNTWYCAVTKHRSSKPSVFSRIGECSEAVNVLVFIRCTRLALWNNVFSTKQSFPKPNQAVVTQKKTVAWKVNSKWNECGNEEGEVIITNLFQIIPFPVIFFHLCPAFLLVHY